MIRRAAIAVACLAAMLICSVDDFGPQADQIHRPETSRALADLRTLAADVEMGLRLAEERERCARHTAELRAAIARGKR